MEKSTVTNAKSTASSQATTEARTCYWDATDREVVVFQIDDGERHWYIAAGMLDALREHILNCDGNEDGTDLSISEVSADQLLTRNEYGGPVDENYPPCFERKNPSDRDPTITSTAAEWAAFYQATAPVQLMSTVF